MLKRLDIRLEVVGNTAEFHFRPWKSLVLQPTSTTSCQRSQMNWHVTSLDEHFVAVIVTYCKHLTIIATSMISVTRQGTDRHLPSDSQ